MSDYELRTYGPGKFSTMVDAYVYELSLDGADAEIGSVDEHGVWYGLLNGRLAGDYDVKGLTEDERKYLASKIGAIVSVDSVGFVTVAYYDTEAALASDWGKIEDNSAFAPDYE